METAGSSLPPDRGLVLILGSECSDSALREILGEAERLGWREQVSRGSEQIVIALDGEGSLPELEAWLARRSELELIPILTHREYARLRTRRKLMSGLAAGLGALTGVAAGAPVVGFLLPPKGSLSDRNLVRAAGKDELGEREAKQITLLGEPVLLVRLDGSRYFALSAVCTHMDICHLEWSPERRLLVCPCHGGAFDVYGNVVKGPPSIPLESFAVEALGQDLFIRRQA